ncbi:peptide/nickel transport system substrate-binding protein [Lishizhenia tianjinensis]|uniref:Peptide/nickel transport system substrate-binding protein n=1 Tax=Lishizhenia tianjinensis TaxID=477690 RepID=A0A1I7BF37_9FLAO|nr:ABC transporter substrate-binding protein [Lishizhenia tianjinensis]SFT85732.1 peptide/nickel transport system substrate-binding protein [Lishizhenia tianjinensis]
MKLIYYYFICVFTFLMSCTSKPEAQIYEYAGGCFKTALQFNPTNVVVEDINDLYTDMVVHQVLEGLFELNDMDLQPVNRLVEDYKIEDNGKKYRFKLRKDIYFHPHSLIGKKHPFEMHDVIATFEHACKANKEGEPSVLYQMVFEGKVKGAIEYFENKTDHLAGMYVENEELVIELIDHDFNFLEKLCVPSAKIIPKEIIEADQGSALVGTGPFVYQGTQLFGEDQAIVMTKNPNYYRVDAKGNSLPYLDSVMFYIEPKNLKQLSDFEEGKIHFVEGIPPARIAMMFEAHQEEFFNEPPQILLRRKPLLGTQYYALNMESPALQDVRVRKALNYGLNKERLVKEVLHDQAYAPGYRGLVPPFVLSDYDKNDSILNGYEFDLAKAKALLAEAGFPNGEGFPTLKLAFDKGTIHAAIAGEFAAQMEQNLGIFVNLEGYSFRKLNEVMSKGQGDIFRSSWYADYKSPESFLNCYNGLLVGDITGKSSKINTSRFRNLTFDEFLKKALNSENKLERLSLFAQAEEVLLAEVPFIILWYDESITLTRSEVRNLAVNEMNIYYLDRVYLKKWSMEEYQNSTGIKG